MSTPRITQRLMVERSLSSMQSGMNRLARSQEQLSTGRLINRPSDSPTGTNDAMRLRAQLAADAQYSRNASDGLSYLGRTDNTLTTMVDNVRRARDLIVQGASTGSNGPDARAAIASELKQIKESLVSLANTEHMGRPLFGGTSTGPAYTMTGTPPATTYNGDDGDVIRVVGDGMPVKVNVTGREAFEVNGDDLFKVMDDTIAAMTTEPADSAAIGDKLTRIDAVSKQMLSALADVGTRYGRVEGALTTLTDTNLDNTAALSEVENVDIAKAVMDLQMAEVAHQAALGATARVLQPSLIDFLR
ncbi:MAG: flagellar hook-associated protein FlgL [Nocardioides sp.]